MRQSRLILYGGKNMQVQILDPSTRRTSLWSGGKTEEWFLYPSDGSYAERRFQVRISSATVDAAESHFTKLPDVTRYLLPLCDGFYLKINGAWQFLPSYKVLRFSGGDDVLCRGRGRDLNLMLKGAHGDMRILEAGDAQLTPHTFLFLYCSGETRVSGTAVRAVYDRSIGPNRPNVRRPAPL